MVKKNTTYRFFKYVVFRWAWPDSPRASPKGKPVDVEHPKEPSANESSEDPDDDCAYEADADPSNDSVSEKTCTATDDDP